MKCLIIWTLVVLLVVCVSAEDEDSRSDEDESVVETLLAAKPKPTVRTTKWIFMIIFVVNKQFISLNYRRSPAGRPWRVVPWTLSVAVTCAERIIMLVIDACKILIHGNRFYIANFVT